MNTFWSYNYINIDETSLIRLKSSCFLCSLFGSDFSADSSFTSWMNILMHVTSFWSSIIKHGILTYVIGAYFSGHFILVCMGHMVIYLLGGIITFMTFWWGTSLMCFFIMFLCTLMIYIIYSWFLEKCIQENGIPEFSFLMVWVGEHS